MDRDMLLLVRDHLLAALGLLTRLPVPVHRPAGAEAAWAWPLVGAGLGAAAAAAGSLALISGVAPGAAAAAVLVVLALLTGALHEDGLADTADGLLGGRDPEARLAIMKDSRIGSFGALALLLVTLAAWSALAALMAEGGHWPALIAASSLSRLPMAVLMAALAPARRGGLSAATGRPGPGVVALATVVALAVAILATGSAAICALLAVAAVCFLLALAARRLIGGQTGDILGAAQQLGFAAVLSVLA